VRDPAVHRRVLAEAVEHARSKGLATLGLTASSLIGPAGNVEFLAHLVLDDVPAPDLDAMIDAAMAEAADRVAAKAGGSL
jgi:23S rRNA (cytidine1920-2'-O)/16S rRNA (cytidine1409-2'-O)-methyltransferase